VETRAGDLLIWNSLTPHDVARNSSGRPRLAQYITMFPVQEDNEELRRSRIRMWRERLTPEGFAFPVIRVNWSGSLANGPADGTG
jgi:ectoine hydroxylase-related dioxygenase (phytanoyl-CoA dioxygenase family)